jgi:YegS/Rv2252/BmrU family lipid kinase
LTRFFEHIINNFNFFSDIYIFILIIMNTEKQTDWLVIINPNAGRRKGERDWNQIRNLLILHNFDFYAIFTEQPRHAIDIARQHIEAGFLKIIVVGGDGTLNEVINGLFLQSKYPTTAIILGMITVGTGNDWGRMLNIPADYEEAILTIKKCRTFVQDAGMVRYQIENDQEDRYFVNIAGLGFDAVVTQKANRLKEKGKGGPLLYFVNIFSSLINYRYVNALINIDGQNIENQIFSMNIGIGKYNGGGMMQVPGAIADDGLFDLTVIKKISKPDVILSLRKLYNGNIVRHPKVDTYTGKSITIDSDTRIHLETDGESLGHTPLEFQIIPKSVQVISGVMVN